MPNEPFAISLEEEQCLLFGLHLVRAVLEGKDPAHRLDQLLDGYFKQYDIDIDNPRTKKRIISSMDQLVDELNGHTVMVMV